MRQQNVKAKNNSKGRLHAALFPRGPERALAVFLTASVFLFGLYPYWSALLAGAFLALLLFLCIKKGKPIVFPLSLPSVSICIAVLFYLFSVCWATDKGMAFLGFLKYLPVPLFITLSATMGADMKQLLRALARAGGFSVAVCLVLSLVPDLRGVIFPDGRFSGPFQYANTYGLFLLVCVVILCAKKPSLKLDYILSALSVMGVLLTGSRSLMILAAAVFVFLLFTNWRGALVSASGVPLAVLLSLLFSMTGTLQRSADISFTSGEWLTRLAYYQDGLRLVLEKPFGMGHLGWWYVQPAIQTSVYNVRLIHNWLLQAALDIGIIPVLFMAAAAVNLFFHKQNGIKEKLLIALILGHGLIDFDLAYLPVVFILVLLLPAERPVKLRVSGRRTIIPLAICSLTIAISLWLGTASFLSYIGHDKSAATLYPVYTEAMEKTLVTESDPNQAALLADRILSRNYYVFDAYDAKARICADKGLWMDAVAMKREFLSISRLHGRDYDDLLMYIHFAIQQAADTGDTNTCRYLADLALGVPETLNELNDSLNPLAYRLKHQPTLMLSDDSMRFLEYLREFRASLG